VTDRRGEPPRSARADSREVQELRAVRQTHPELAAAAEMHLELIELHRRIQSRVPVPALELSTDLLTRHQNEGRPLLHFDRIPLDLTDLRLMVRQTADVLRRFGALEAADYERVHALGRDMDLAATASRWYHSTAGHCGGPAGARSVWHGGESAASDIAGQVLTLAMRPFLARCAEVLQRWRELSLWTHSHCPLCGGEPELAVITAVAERHLICGRCTLQWRFDQVACPYCGNDAPARITSFATEDRLYRVDGCDVCQRYMKAYDTRRSKRPVMPMVDGVLMLPLDAAAMQRGYRS
jgi:hypothetical protein